MEEGSRIEEDRLGPRVILQLELRNGTDDVRQLVELAAADEADDASAGLDPARNEAAVKGKEADISTTDAKVRTLVIPTNEELIIARDTLRLVKGKLQPTG